MALSAAHRRLLIVDNGVGAAAFNFALNGAIAWLLFRSATHVPLWGQPSVAGDTLVTAFLLPFLTCLIVSRLVARQVEEGRIPRLSGAERASSPWSQRSPLLRGTLLGAASVGLAAVPVVAALSLWGPAGFALWPFIGFKAAFAAALAAIVTPLVAWWALLHASG